jgi:trigger factor
MKKRLATILACALAVSTMAACGNTAGNPTESTNGTGAIANQTILPSIELAEIAEGTGLHEIPVEDYVVLGDYKNMSFSVAPKAEITEEDVEMYAKYYFEDDLSYADKSIFETKGTVAEGDFVLMDYMGKLNGVAFDGGTATDAILEIGSGTFIDGFEDGLIGVSIGETVDLNLTFPKDYGNTDLAGKATVFTVTVKGTTQYVDKTIAALGHEVVKTVAEYEETIKDMLEYQAEQKYYDEVAYAICDILVGNSVVSKIPSNIFEEQKNYVIAQVETEAAYYSLDGDSYTQAYIGVNLADYAVTVAEEYSVQAVIFQAIANREDLNPTEEEMKEYIEGFIDIYGENYDIKTVEDFYKTNSENDVRMYIMQENVVKFIKEHATITEVSTATE